MDPTSSLSEQDRWRSAVLDEVFKAMAASPALSESLVYKGARVLRLRLKEVLRASFDIDASLASFAANAGMATDGASRESLRSLAHKAIVHYFENQDPVRYELTNSTLASRRRIGPHPRGWDVYWLDIQIRDLTAEGAAVAPASQLRIDIAAPELLSEYSVSPIELDGHIIKAVTLERISGEKLRAFLSCLPTYRRKLKETTDVERRVKDLYDLVRIISKRPLTDEPFWVTAGGEFQLACKSRYIDCSGLPSFKEDWDRTRQEYAAAKTLPSDVTFEQAETTLEQVAAFLAEKGFTPIAFDIPPIDEPGA